MDQFSGKLTSFPVSEDECGETQILQNNNIDGELKTMYVAFWTTQGVH